ncbi:MAG TPA: hypothetical protein VKG05_13720, partial [Steroidobacteraceae bacterium]|nr:hypothetical protein [Steroidobacteraceae bacterium]
DQARGPLSVGMYVGEQYHKWYLQILYEPENLVMASTYIAAANVNYRFYESSKLPLQFEGEFDVDKHFGEAHEYEVVLAPFVRWTSFPWNDHLYTNARVSVLGLSYVTGVSAWEKQDSGHEKGSNFLQFGSLELTFAGKKTSPGEFFVRVHHRSGMFGLINGVAGGSNYLSVGYRVFW